MIRLSAVEHILLLVFHHITFDAWSERVFLKELSVLYAAFSHGAPSPLPELPIQYADYAVWQRERMEIGELQGHLAYWKSKLGDRPPALELPSDYLRPALYSSRGAKFQSSLPAALVTALKDLGLRQNATLSMVLLSAYLTLLFRYTAQPDAVIGMPVAGRTLLEMESLIGLFINPLVLRCNLAGQPTFLELLARIRQVVLDAVIHQEIPLEKLVAEINPPRDPSRTPFFQVVFNYKNIPDRSVQFPGLEIAPYDLDLGVAPYDLTLELVPGAESTACTFIYNTDLYQPSTIEKLARGFSQLLYAVLANPEHPFTRLPGLSEKERRQLLLKSAPTVQASPEPSTEPAQVLATPTSFEQVLARIWAEILEIEQVGPYNSFFELGGNSMQAIRMVDRLEALLQTHIDLHWLFQAPDLHGFAGGILENVPDRSLVDDLAHWLIELDGLSDDEAIALLAEIKARKG